MPFNAESDLRAADLHVLVVIAPELLPEALLSKLPWRRGPWKFRNLWLEFSQDYLVFTKVLFPAHPKVPAALALWSRVPTACCLQLARWCPGGTDGVRSVRCGQEGWAEPRAPSHTRGTSEKGHAVLR